MRANEGATAMADATTAVVVVPGLKLVSFMNGSREHWSKTAKRKHEQKAATRLALAGLGSKLRERFRDAPTVTVRFTRVGGRKLDTDNCTVAFKYVRDIVAEWMGKDDGATSGIEWVLPPAQEPGKEYSVRIELSTPGAA